jgi:hypothetical protein
MERGAVARIGLGLGDVAPHDLGTFTAPALDAALIEPVLRNL